MKNLYDVVIVGGGPAGLTAAVYLTRARYRVLVLEKEQFGGQIAITEEVVNYPGIAKISGRELTDIMQKQARDFGAEFRLEEAVGFQLEGDIKSVRTEKETYHCLGVLLATGAHPRTVGFRGEDRFKGRGVAYCATCDGAFFADKEVFVVGGGFAAAEESVFLTKFARHVTVLVRKNDFSCAASVAEKTKKHEKITVLNNTVLEEVDGEKGLNYARYKNTQTGQVTEYRAEEGDHFGVFVFAGYAPATEAVKGLVEMNEQGYIITDRGQKTSIKGVYAAGDVCIKPLRQVVTATGDGALAATELERYVAAIREKTGLGGERIQPRPSEDRGIFSGEMTQQLKELFSRMEQGLVLKLFLDPRPASRELEQLMEMLAAMTDKLRLEKKTGERDTPCVRVLGLNGSDTGLAFHGVPGGHEFTSFVLGLYNAAGPGQPLEDGLLKRIQNIKTQRKIQILVTLSCNLCPETVQSAQRIAAKNEKISAEVYDAALFPELRERYQVMSVPCMIVDEDKVSFGKKNMEQVLELLEQ